MSRAANDVGGRIDAAFLTKPNRAERRRLAAETKRPGKACACCQPAAGGSAIDIHRSQIGSEIKR